MNFYSIVIRDFRNYFCFMNYALKSKNVLTQDVLIEAQIIIQDGVIKEVRNYKDKSDCEVKDYGELMILPGLVDTHVHINEPGRTEWEGFETATKSAAAGGITMLVDMPLNSSPVTTNPESFKKKINSAKNKIWVDCGFYGGIIPGNVNSLRSLVQCGVLGLKAFLINSGIDEFPSVTKDDLRIALSDISGIDNSGNAQIPLLVHAELESDNINNSMNYDDYSFNSFVNSRPKEWENKAIEMLINLCREFDYHIHIVHLSSSDAIDLIRKAKDEGLKLTVETCPHYLFFSSGQISSKDTRFKCTPPIRDNENKEKLWGAVKEGIIDFIVSDHSPCDPELKCLNEGNFTKAWGGISSLQLGLSIIWTEGSKRGFSISEVSKLMSTKTASFINMGHRKGKIERGFDADITIFDPSKRFRVEENNLFSKHKLTPYSGRELYGVIEATYLKGEKIFEGGKIVSEPKGKIILNSGS